MTKLAQLEIQVRVLRARLDRLEARRQQPKREAAPRPDGAVVGAREKLWAQYLLLEMTRGHGRVRLTKLNFALRRKLNPDEFCRWFSARDRRGIPEGSGPDVRFRQALADAIAELEAREKNIAAAVVERNGTLYDAVR
jgi:hypothetical protein